ncbi:hypothetical protein M8J76_000988 [Diaphorina citri]|nr:hypothetical protein M8J75_000882 [Diaphorina citri]KAI5721923.1 hypothetical protein M8J76_000988 [Diaphorina citri]
MTLSLTSMMRLLPILLLLLSASLSHAQNYNVEDKPGDDADDKDQPPNYDKPAPASGYDAKPAPAPASGYDAKPALAPASGYDKAVSNSYKETQKSYTAAVKVQQKDNRSGTAVIDEDNSKDNKKDDKEKSHKNKGLKRGFLNEAGECWCKCPKKKGGKKKPDPPKNDYKPDPPKNDYKPDPPKNDYKPAAKNDYKPDPPKNDYKPEPPKSDYKPDPPKNDYKPDPPKNDYKPDPPKNDYRADNTPSGAPAYNAALAPSGGSNYGGY